MNSIFTLASRMLANKHTSAAAIIYALAKWGCPFLSVWFPELKPKLDSSAQVLEGAAVFYGFAAAGDSATSAQAHAESQADIKGLQTQVDTNEAKAVDRAAQPGAESKP